MKIYTSFLRELYEIQWKNIHLCQIINTTTFPTGKTGAASENKGAQMFHFQMDEMGDEHLRWWLWWLNTMSEAAWLVCWLADQPLTSCAYCSVQHWLAWRRFGLQSRGLPGPVEATCVCVHCQLAGACLLHLSKLAFKVLKKKTLHHIPN